MTTIFLSPSNLVDSKFPKSPQFFGVLNPPHLKGRIWVSHDGFSLVVSISKPPSKSQGLFDEVEGW